MFEPITLTVTELAARWNRTPKQILEFAQHLGVPLYFNYGCLAFEETDSWHKFSGDQREVRERDFLTKAVESREEQLMRARDGLLSRWEQLPPGGAPELRKEINIMKSKLRFIDELLEQREMERAQCVLGFLRPGPGTLLDIANNGQTAFPRWVFHSAGKITTHVVHDERGNPYLEWIGRRMILEPRNSDDPQWRKMLSLEDLFASMDEVKAIEAQSTPAQDVEHTARPPHSLAPAEFNLIDEMGRPPQAMQWQEQEILRVIREMGLSATAIPKPLPGKSGIKAVVRKKLNLSPKVFDLAWERLRADDRLVDATLP